MNKHKITIVILLVIVVVGLVFYLNKSHNTEKQTPTDNVLLGTESTKEKIDITKYETFADYGPLSAEQKSVMNTILLCGTSGATVIEQNLSFGEFEEVIDCIGLYFGANLEHQGVALWRKGYAEVRPERIRTLEQKKAVLDTEIDRIMSNMDEGTDEEKLLQISDYIANTITYSYSIDYIEPLSGFAGKGSCMTYSMLFYKMATRIGIQTYICYGDADNGKMVGMHAWNMVVLDGEQYFYDVTWYDKTVPDLKYIYSKTAWGRKYTALPSLKEDKTWLM